MTDIDDRRLAAYLSAMAFMEIRGLAGRARRGLGRMTPVEALERIRFLADLCDNMPLSPAPRRRRKARNGGRMSPRERAMRERPMSYVWAVSGPEKRAWIIGHIERAGWSWTPPPPLPATPKGPMGLSWWQRTGLARWPVTTRPGQVPLPREARRVKAVDGDVLFALHEKDKGDHPGSDAHLAWLRAHIDRRGEHFLFPEPAPAYGPDPEPDFASAPWRCGVLLRMADGEQVRDAVTLLPETFRALPSTLPRLRQRRLVHVARATRRDLHLWDRDHEPDCTPELCQPWRTSSGDAQSGSNP